MHQDERGASDGPRIFAGLVGEDLVEAFAPVGACRSGLESLVIRRNKGAGAVGQLHVLHLVLLDIRVLHVADRVGQTADEGCNALVALSARAGGPVHCGAFAHGGLPLLVHLAQVVGEDEAGARTVGAAHRSDVGIRQLHAGVQRNDGRIVPALDLAQINIAQHMATQLHLAGFDALNVDHRHHTTDHGGELHQPLRGQFLVFQGCVGRAEVHRLGVDLADTGARADRLVIDAHAGRLVVVRRPFGIQRCGKAGARAGGLLLRVGAASKRRSDCARDQNSNH